ncbi:MAG: hypothetical protein GX121_02680 [Ignavibacteria bacterium]|nr:hypothetical protein [Ignavibacteria bacterium]
MAKKIPSNKQNVLEYLKKLNEIAENEIIVKYWDYYKGKSIIRNLISINQHTKILWKTQNI